MSITVTLNIDGPRDPQYVLEVAEAAPEAVRTLNHLTFAHSSLQYPSEADRLLHYLSSAVGGYPQLLGQVMAWLEAEQQAGRVRVADGQFVDNPAGAIDMVRAKLDAAREAAEALWSALHAARSVTNNLGAPWPEVENEK